uniref:Dynein axonemal assembly factor 4 n=1 Tax=Chlamydomonas reinhardtii TaxID=3055 RepID=A0A286T4S6_CHLRE|nr:DYX1C1-like protein [Chlamydomonas reinhardtii]
MPLAPKYTWTETDVAIEVTVEVPGVSKSKADVFATDAFLKVNSPPYLFALDLAKDVDDTRSSATILPGKVVFTLFKREPGVWGVLAATGEKAALTSRRNASIDRAYAALEAARRARLERKQHEDKAATQRTLDTDRRKRAEVEARKAAELAAERGSLQQWQQRLGLGQEQDAESDYEEEDEQADGAEEGRQQQQQAGGGEGRAAPDHPDYHGRGWRTSGAAAATGAAAAAGKAAGAAAAGSAGLKAPGRGVDSEEEEDEGAERRAGGRGAGSDSEEEAEAAAPGPAAAGVGAGGAAAAGAVAARPASFKPLPPPRARLEPVQVTFTQLETGHLPAREHREEEIRAFRKQSRASALEAGAAAGGGGDDAADLSERQPLFLKDKGDAMFRAGNFSGALNAYHRAIALDDAASAAASDPAAAAPALRSNRAACLLALGRAAEAAEDCDRALELLAGARSRLESGLMGGPEAAALSQQLVRLLVRRAQARAAQLGAGGGGGGGGRDKDRDADNLCAALRDYEDAIKLAPSAAALAADRDELLAALAPADAAALRQRGDARFRAGDYEGAAEAFSALLGLPRGGVPESERLAAFSNRAACHLVLERFAAAVADCDAGLALLLLLQPQQQAQAAASSSAFGMAAGGEGRRRLAEWAAASLPAAAAADASSPSGGAESAAAAQAAVSAARLLTRRGAAAAHLQDFAAAAEDHALAAALLRRLPGPEHAAKAEAAEADAARMRALAEGREQPPSRPAAEAASASQPVVKAEAAEGVEAGGLEGAGEGRGAGGEQQQTCEVAGGGAVAAGGRGAGEGLADDDVDD